MTIRYMRIFVEVYQALNITKAAEQLHMTQPAVTRAIQELEHYYGVRLFERINRRLVVTETGRQLYPQALHIIDSFDALEKGLHGWDTFGILRVGASITIGNCLLPRLMERARQISPHIRLYAEIRNSAALQAALIDNRLDLALVENKVEDANLQMQEFERDELVLITSPSHPLLRQQSVRLEDLQKYPFLMREPGSAGRNYLDHLFASRSLAIQPILVSVSTQAIVQFVHHGLGIALLPRQLVDADAKSGRISICSMTDAALIRRHYIVWHQNKYLSPMMKQFMALCTEKG